MTNEIRQKLDKIGALAWTSADSMRGNMDASEYRGPLLGLQCYAYLSQEFEKEAATYFGTGTTFKEEWDAANEDDRKDIQDNFITYKPGYFIKPEYLFKEFVAQAKAGKFKASDLATAITAFDNAVMSSTVKNNINIFNKLFEMINVNSSATGSNPAEKNQMFSEVIKNVDIIQEQINKIQEEDPTVDAMAYIYEYLLARFASSAGKKGGEFLTPACACKLLSKLTLASVKNPKNISTIADPTCGTLSLVNAFIEELREIDKTTADNVHIYGQEKNSTTAKLAGINMLYHKIPSNMFNVFNADTLTNDCFKTDTGDSMKLDVQIANPPYSVNHTLTEENRTSDDRFSGYSKLAPKTKADFAFLQHMVAHASENGHIGVILPHGVLFRGASEGTIRKEMLNIKNPITGKRILDGVIGIPAGMFYGTGIPVCMILIHMEKDDDNVVFIDASKDFIKDKQNYLSDEQIDKIVKAYSERKDVDKFCHVATFAEIERNEYNLNIPRYVDTTEEKEEIDIKAVLKEIERLDKEIETSKKAINASLKSLGIIE